jgi:hypothetical protein
MRIKLIYILILFVSVSCKKYGDGYVQGQVLESDTKTPIAGAMVYIGKWKVSRISSNYSYIIIDSVTTDNSGSYNIPFNKKRGYRYSVYARHSKYMSRNIADDYELNFKKTTKDFELDALAYLKFRIKKNSPSLNYFNATINLKSTNLYVLQNHLNPYDTILPQVYKANGVATNYIEWEIIGTSSGKTRDEKLLPRGDTTILYYQVN